MWDRIWDVDNRESAISPESIAWREQQSEPNSRFINTISIHEIHIIIEIFNG